MKRAEVSLALLMEAALDTAFAAVQGDIDADVVPGEEAFPDPRTLEPIRLLSHALLHALLQALTITVELDARLKGVETAPAVACLWCLEASGDDAASHAIVGARAHTMSCEHNPVVAAIVEFFAALDETTSELVPAVLRRPRLDAAEEALREIALNTQHGELIAALRASAPPPAAAAPDLDDDQDDGETEPQPAGAP